MNKFIKHIIIVSVLLLSSYVLVFMQTNGYSDPYYMRISSPRKSNLIIGTSKSAQGVQPQVLQDILHKDFFNYSFSINISPFGETYLKSIKAKLDTTQKDNIFVITVDAWSLCSENSTCFREKKSFLAKLNSVTQNPNFQYLIKYFDGKYYKILIKKSSAFLHKNGWLEVQLAENEDATARRQQFTMKSYSEKAKKYKFSEKRFNYLLETIDFLQQYGKIYLVRLPVSAELMQIEQNLMSNFDEKISPAVEKSEMYLDLTKYNAQMKYTDGVHLNIESGREITKIIGNEINNALLN